MVKERHRKNLSNFSKMPSANLQVFGHLPRLVPKSRLCHAAVLRGFDKGNLSALPAARIYIEDLCQFYFWPAEFQAPDVGRGDAFFLPFADESALSLGDVA